MHGMVIPRAEVSPPVGTILTTISLSTVRLAQKRVTVRVIGWCAVMSVPCFGAVLAAARRNRSTASSSRIGYATRLEVSWREALADLAGVLSASGTGGSNPIRLLDRCLATAPVGWPVCNGIHALFHASRAVFRVECRKVRDKWLGRQDSNLGMGESKSPALPLGYAPMRRRGTISAPPGAVQRSAPPVHNPRRGKLGRGWQARDRPGKYRDEAPSPRAACGRRGQDTPAPP